jgi:hypothetical protein
MIVYVLFVHKKSLSKRKVCIIFIKNLKFKNPQKNIFSGFFWVGFFYCQPCLDGDGEERATGGGEDDLTVGVVGDRGKVQLTAQLEAGGGQGRQHGIGGAHRHRHLEGIASY